MNSPYEGTTKGQMTYLHVLLSQFRPFGIWVFHCPTSRGQNIPNH